MTPAERARQWRLDNPERERATKAAYRAAHPEQRKATNARYIEKNRDAINAKAQATRAQFRADAIAAYGGHCACPGCHVHHAELMTIDHINGDAHHRQSPRNRSTGDFYRWLAKQGYPADYQLLCGSCNLAKSNRAQCPLAGQDH
jgi:hypothetical protein